ncbi:N-acyl-L-amino acid amidohydrolase [Synergistales bacterium]|nr:N-acyl-L-amino acid amidohydrolase [Synergistales bacterium]
MSEALSKKITQMVREVVPEVTEWRHTIHKNPELAFHETDTSALIEKSLLESGIDKIRRVGSSNTGICAELYGTAGGEGRCIGIRADIDALPIQEQSGVNYASLRDGVFHGCGHDSHTAILMGTARLLSRFREQFSGCVKFFFQHAEEELGGGREFIEAGVMENPHVDEVMALHALPDILVGEIGVRDDFMTAGVDLLEITIEGKQAHGGYPHFGVDTILAASTIVTTLQSLGSRELAPTDCALVTFGRIEGGISNSYIGGPVVLEGCIRYLRKPTQELFHRRVREIAESVGQGLRARVSVKITPEAIPTCVDRACVERIRRAARGAESVKNIVELPSPAMGGEDYACFLEKAPGSLFRLGVRTPGGQHCPTHSINFYVDDDALTVGMEVMTAAALDALGV